MRPKAIIIGGGLGGLAAALTLSDEYEVHIFEKNDTLGGKMKAMDFDDYHFDFGPNTLTMPHYFWQVIEPFCPAKERLPFQKIDRPTSHQLENYRLTFSTDEQFMVEQLGLIDEVSAANYPAFLKEITRLFHLSEQAFLKKTFFSRKDYLNPELARALLEAQPFKTLDSFLSKYFPHPFVRQLFNRFATYIGSSPFATPATFAMIAYFELVEGTYFIEGGATKIAAIFHELLLEQNVVIHLNEPILNLAVNNGTLQFCETPKGRFEADLFICNTDYDYFQRLLGRKVVTNELSTSAYVELVGLKEPVSLAHHNLLFSEHYKDEFTALRAGQYAVKPTVYSCYPFASDSSHPPALFVLINAPSSGVASNLQEQHVTRALEQWGIASTNIAVRQVVPPAFLEEEFNVVAGAIYGRASNSLKGSFFRPPNKDFKLNNLYYVGGTVHPGGGSPIVVKGGYSVAKRILEKI